MESCIGFCMESVWIPAWNIAWNPAWNPIWNPVWNIVWNHVLMESCKESFLEYCMEFTMEFLWNPAWILHGSLPWILPGILQGILHGILPGILPGILHGIWILAFFCYYYYLFCTYTIFTVHDVSREILLVKQLPMLFDVLAMYCIWVIVPKASTAHRKTMCWNHICMSILAFKNLQAKVLMCKVRPLK